MGRSYLKTATSVAPSPSQCRLHPILVLQPFLLCLPPVLLQHEYLFIPARFLSSLFFSAYLWLLPFSSRPLQPELGHYVWLVAEAINLRGQHAAWWTSLIIINFPHHAGASLWIWGSCTCAPGGLCTPTPGHPLHLHRSLLSWDAHRPSGGPEESKHSIMA